MILDFRAATLADADSVADVYLCSRKELVACAPLAHSDQAVREWIRQQLIPAGRTTVAVVDDLVVGLLAVSNGADCSWIDQLYLLPAWDGNQDDENSSARASTVFALRPLTAPFGVSEM
ncbi:MAG TPA: hypothetical protein VFV05_26490 [Methylomirabilota bacterium]|nr:hypothetical protein [Methylomirabilota bacterium]